MYGWVDLRDLLHTEMVYLPADGHPSKYQPGPVSINYADQANALTTTLRHYFLLPRDAL